MSLIQSRPESDAMAMFLAMTSGVADMVLAGFGANNDKYVRGLGRALDMYARFKGSLGNHDNLKVCENMYDILGNEIIMQEITSDENLVSLIASYPNIGEVYGTMIANDSVTKKGAQTNTYPLTVTEEHLSGKKAFFYNVKLSTPNVASASANIKFNGVTLGSISNNKTQTFVGVLNLADCGVTEVGTYNLTCYINSNHTTTYSASGVYKILEL